MKVSRSTIVRLGVVGHTMGSRKGKTLAYQQKEQRPNSGILFKNNKKTAGSKQPDYTGNWTDENGNELRLAAWIKDAKNGSKFMTLSASDPATYQERSADSGEESQDDGAPF